PKHFPVPADHAARTIVAADLAAGTDAALRLAGALMRACWAEDRDIADAATVAAIVGEQGLDAGALGAKADEAARLYDAYTDEAIERQVFGAPFYVIGDRLESVERALAKP
ncbi:MAG TPA: DsbA family protein, partial [Burkholderiaceae bacterium]|nr:DsbA family protein [Burkholderiaceae bacterium]